MSGLLQSLFMRSSIIQKTIEEERSSRAPSWTRLLRLKKIRLKIKDRIHSLMYGQQNNWPEPEQRVYIRW